MDIRQQAQDLYLQTNLSQATIAGTIGVSTRTLQRWIKEENWQHARAAACHAPVLIMEQLYSQLAELNAAIASREPGYRFPTLHEAEVIRKLLLSIDKLKGQSALSAQMQMMQSFVDYVRQSDDEMAKQVTLLADTYFQRRGKKVQGFKPYELEYGVADADVPETDTPATSAVADNISVAAVPDNASHGEAAQPTKQSHETELSNHHEPLSHATLPAPLTPAQVRKHLRDKKAVKKKLQAKKNALPQGTLAQRQEAAHVLALMQRDVANTAHHSDKSRHHY